MSKIFIFPFVFVGMLFSFEILEVNRFVPQGGVVKIVVRSSNRCEVSFGGKNYPLFREGKINIGYIPVDVHLKGEIPLVVEEKKLFSSKKTEISVEVKEVAWPSSTISIERESIPRYPENEKKKVRETFRKFSKEKLYSKFSLPLKGFPITTDFGARRFDKNGRVLWQHNGIDIAAPRGTPVNPAGRGRVDLILRNSPTNGNMVVIDHGRGIKSAYLHLDEISCKEGEILEAEDTLGTVGSTGISTGPHLHLGIYLFGVCVNPRYFAGLVSE